MLSTQRGARHPLRSLSSTRSVLASLSLSPTSHVVSPTSESLRPVERVSNLTVDTTQNYGYPAPPPGQPGSMAAILNNQDSFSAAVAAAQQQQQGSQGQGQGQGPGAQGQNGAGSSQAQQQQALVGDEEYKLRFESGFTANVTVVRE